MRRAAAGLLAAALAGCIAGPSGNPAVPEPLKPLSLERYAGRWYEIARYPNRFERGCQAVTAEYALKPDGEIAVVNTCRKGSPDGPVEVARGRARRAGPDGSAKLEVSFFGPFFSPYWVVDRADDYGWAIVSEPEGRLLWILARDPGADRSMLTARARALGFDTARLEYPEQPPR